MQIQSIKVQIFSIQPSSELPVQSIRVQTVEQVLWTWAFLVFTSKTGNLVYFKENGLF